MVTLIKTCLTVEKRDTIKFTIQNGKTSKQPQRKMLQGELNNSNKAASLTIKPGLRAKRKSSTTWTIDTKLWECYLPPFIQDKIYGKLEMAWKWGRIATHEAIMNVCLSLKASMLDYLPLKHLRSFFPNYPDGRQKGGSSHIPPLWGSHWYLPCLVKIKKRWEKTQLQSNHRTALQISCAIL